MEFLLIAHDGDDAEAPARRASVRAEHLEGVRAMKADGRFISGGALLGDSGEMVGSALILSFPDRGALDAWLTTEVYVTGEVWKRIEITPYRQAPI